VEPIRVLLFQLPPILAEIVKRSAAAHPSLEVVGEVKGGRVVGKARRKRARCVLTNLDGAELTPPIHALFQALPSVAVIDIEGQGKTAVLYELRPHRVPLGEVSASELVETVASACGARAPDWNFT
jgi:DNA-binding NarL/FixJ family response regulator